jgi:anaerobic selenocysteine-containing dehydrogenase
MADQTAVTTRDSIRDVWGERTPTAEGIWPARVDEHIIEEPDRWVQGACLLCSNGCGLDIGVKDGRMVGVRGREGDRVNRGRLGPKGLHGWIANHSPDRLTRPLVRRHGRLEPVSWDEAMDIIVRRSRDIRDAHTSSAIGFYTSGQLFLEEYYTLAVIGKAGLGTPHMDGNTRLCTATSAAALKLSFGTDGQPGSYADLDVTDAIMHVGHNIASQQTVLWMRILDRLASANRPKLLVIDPRTTETAKQADVHLAPRVGTNVAVLNGLQHLLIASGRLDETYIREHTTGFEALERMVAKWTPDHVRDVAAIEPLDLRAAAAVIGESPSLVTTVLQGVYQSHQATAASVQVNNIHLLRGLLGKPGCCVLQMNGQPTAQNTRECGADGDLPGFRNWENPRHIADLARIWNVDAAIIPSWSPPTHAMQIFRYAEQGSLKMLWVSGTNPAVSLPDLPRIRRILGGDGLFVIVQDAWLTETTEYADVVLPTALWGEKTGCFTNVDRTVHLSQKAVDPPGEARSDLDIFLDYAERMEFRDRDGAPLIKWRTPEEAFEAWKACSKGRPCDYSGMSYGKLSGTSGIQWPCNERFPDGAERLYVDGRFNTAADYCETFGHDLTTGAENTPEEYQARDPRGRALFFATDFQAPHERPDHDYPLWLTTGRVLYHFHTRTKTARAPELNEAAPDAFAQISEEDAAALAIRDGDLVAIETRRGRISVPAKVGDIIRGHIFVPFHYGYWDDPGHARAANELTIAEWDPVSKQPYYKYAAASLHKVEAQSVIAKAAEAVENVGAQLKHVAAGIKEAPAKLKKAMEAAENRLPLSLYVGLLHRSEEHLSDAFKNVADHHRQSPDIYETCMLMAGWSAEHVQKLHPLIARYREESKKEPDRLRRALFEGPRSGGVGLLRDLHDLWLAAAEVHLCYEAIRQAGRALHDRELVSFCEQSGQHTDRQLAWLRTRIDQAAPQALTVT